MLFFNIWLVYLSIRIRSRAGAHNKDSEWTFGQILALATWVPFLAEFADTWLEEPEDALNGRLPAPYEVVVNLIAQLHWDREVDNLPVSVGDPRSRD